MRESALVRKIKAAVKAQWPTAYVRKLADRQTRGLPDLLIVVPRDMRHLSHSRPLSGITIFVETKTATGKVAAIQNAEQSDINVTLNCANVKAIVARDVETVINKLREMGA